PADPAVHRRVCADAARALRLLQRDGDEFWEAILLYNRACLYLDRGELDAAEADARRAHTLYSRVGGEGAAVDALEVLGEVALLRDEGGGLVRGAQEAGERGARPCGVPARTAARRQRAALVGALGHRRGGRARDRGLAPRRAPHAPARRAARARGRRGRDRTRAARARAAAAHAWHRR